MTGNEIRAELIRRGIRVVGFARKIGYHHSTVSLVIDGKRSTPYIRQKIAQAIGKSEDEVFP